MKIDAVKAFKLPEVVQSYTDKDTMLYALGLGYGGNPTIKHELQFVYEAQLRSVPSMSVVLAHPGFWLKDPSLEIDWMKVLHGEQSFEMLRPLPPAGTVRGEYEIQAVEDRGDKGAVMYLTKRLFDEADGSIIATVHSTYMLRGDGNCGGFGERPEQLPPLPESVPDKQVTVKTLPQMALIYRLSGDRNPIHADPDAAKQLGFKQPILHGLCSLGIATRALIASCADNDPDRLVSLAVRFSKPVYPGETLEINIFKGGEQKFFFSAMVPERGIKVLDRGVAGVAT